MKTYKCEKCSHTTSQYDDGPISCICLNGKNVKLSNLEIIKAAYAMGYAAQLIIPKMDGEHIVIQSLIQGIVTISKSEKYGALYFENERLKGIKITGYLYGGQLCGNEPIPEGQRFRVKVGNEIGKIVTALKYEEGDAIERIYCKEDRGYYASQVEPVFD